MIDFAHTNHSTHHAGVERVQLGYQTLQGLIRSFTSARGLSAMLLGAVVATLVVVADTVMDTWAEENLMLAWIALWAMVFVAIGLLASATRNIAARTIQALNAWSASMARARADERLWEAARHDPRIMEEIRQAQARALGDEQALTAQTLPSAHSADAARSANISVEIDAYQHRLRRTQLATH
jgi:hypothetical protein